MMDGSSLGRAMGDAVNGLLWLCGVSIVVAWPLAIWKMFDIIWWLCSHIHITTT